MRGKFEKRIVATVLVIFLLSSIVSADRPSAWAVEPVKSMTYYGLSNDSFKSNFGRTLQRNEFAYLAVKLYEKATGKKNTATVHPFTDTIFNEYEEYVAKAYNLGIVKGISKTYFDPEGMVTRQEICAMLVRTIKAIESEANTSAVDDIEFVDNAKISSWARNDVVFSYKNNIMQGTAPLKIDPLLKVTSEQALALVYRLGLERKYFVALTEEQLVKQKIFLNKINGDYDVFMAKVPVEKREQLKQLIDNMDAENISFSTDGGVSVTFNYSDYSDFDDHFSHIYAGTLTLELDDRYGDINLVYKGNYSIVPYTIDYLKQSLFLLPNQDEASSWLNDSLVLAEENVGTAENYAQDKFVENDKWYKLIVNNTNESGEKVPPSYQIEFFQVND